MLNFSIMSLNEDHIDQICDDIAYQVTSKIATMPLFSFTLTPEGIPTIDKADLLCNTYEKFKKRFSALFLRPYPEVIYLPHTAAR